MTSVIRGRRRGRAGLGGALFVIGLLGCEATDEAVTDAGTRDAAADPDAAADAGHDAGAGDTPDAGHDAGHDAGENPDADVTPDADTVDNPDSGGDEPETGPWLEQGWTAEQRTRFHYTSQGTSLPVPYEWFVALEQISPDPAIESPLLIESAYMETFGFLGGTVDDTLNPDGLPVGFARADPFVNPISQALNPNPGTGEPYTAVGFTCAACHTAKLTYQGKTLYIDGGPAMTDLGAFRQSLGAALSGLANGDRFARFAARVVTLPDADGSLRTSLAIQVSSVLQQLALESQSEQDLAVQRVSEGELLVEEGPMRLDALARIGNQIFWTQQSRAIPSEDWGDNYRLPNAPVNYPHIWGAPWFDWVQYNGSIRQAMFRNYSQALGVAALVNLGNDPATSLRATPIIEHLAELEELLAGEDPFPEQQFQGLRAPRWPEAVLGPIDQELAETGKALYQQHCQSCHLPEVGSDAFWSETYWRREEDVNGHVSERRYLQLPLVPMAVIGTDPMQAENMAMRTVQLPPALGGELVSYADALGSLEAVIEQSYDEAGLSDEERDAYDGYRKVGLRGELAYRARPLDGVWATPPYLHNASVPSMYQLLSPADERSSTFYLGSVEYDPHEMGIDVTEAEGRFRFDTTVAGNFNSGHEFSDETDDGVLGPELSHGERMAIIEYLKTL